MSSHRHPGLNDAGHGSAKEAARSGARGNATGRAAGGMLQKLNHPAAIGQEWKPIPSTASSRGRNRIAGSNISAHENEVQDPEPDIPQPRPYSRELAPPPRLPNSQVSTTSKLQTNGANLKGALPLLSKRNLTADQLGPARPYFVKATYTPSQSSGGGKVRKSTIRSSCS
jgi:hypothetical protein